MVTMVNILEKIRTNLLSFVDIKDNTLLLEIPCITVGGDYMPIKIILQSNGKYTITDAGRCLFNIESLNNFELNNKLDYLNNYIITMCDLLEIETFSLNKEYNLVAKDIEEENINEYIFSYTMSYKLLEHKILNLIQDKYKKF